MHASPYFILNHVPAMRGQTRAVGEEGQAWKEESEEERVLHRRMSPEAWDQPQVREQLFCLEEEVPLEPG